MKKIIETITITGCLLGNLCITPVPANAQKQLVVRFYCGQSFDPGTNKIIPTTLIATSSRKEPIAFIQWKSTNFGRYTPKNRCDIVSPKLQQAWEGRRLNYLMAGTSKSTGQGIICGAKNRSDKCNESNMIFTLASGADANEVIDRIKNIQTGKSSNPIAQSTGENLADMQQLVEQLQ